MSEKDFASMSFEEVVEFCLQLEKDAVALYEDLAAGATDESGRERFLALVKMERGHVKKLEELDSDAFFQSAPRKVVDLKTTDYMVPMETGKQLNTQEALILAAQREKVTKELYETLAKKYAGEPLLFNFFSMMAEEEAAHKHDLEEEYERSMHGEF